MKKKILFLMAAFALFVPNVMAATKEVATDEELIKAFSEAATGDTIKLTADIENHKGDGNSLKVKDGKELTLDLNGHNFTVDSSEATNRSFIVYGGKLTITGKGTIKHPTHNAVSVWSDSDKATPNFSVLNVEKDVKLIGTTGIAVFHDAGKNIKKGYNSVVNFSGTIESTKDNGITISGNIINKDDTTTQNFPVVNIKKGAKITSTGEEGVGIYAAGAGVWNIEDGVTVTGTATAIGIKSGTINIKGGNFTANGKYVGNPELYSDGLNPSGSAIQIETNSIYYGHINLNIEDGIFTSENGNVILEYGSDTTSAVEGLKITYGEFNAAEGKEILAISKALKTAQANNVISIEGGLFNNDVDDEYLGTDNIVVTIAASITEDGKTVTENMYTVVVEKGDVFDEDAEKELTSLLGDIGEGYKLVGYYSDKELKNKFDFSKELNENTTIYMSFVKETIPQGEKNPKTSDMNLALILTTLGLASVGAVLVSRKKLAKANR